jgi:hypothetical protein
LSDREEELNKNLHREKATRDVKMMQRFPTDGEDVGEKDGILGSERENREEILFEFMRREKRRRGEVGLEE